MRCIFSLIIAALASGICAAFTIQPRTVIPRWIQTEGLKKQFLPAKDFAPARPSTSSFTSLYSSKNDDTADNSITNNINIPYALLYVTFLTFAFNFAPGTLNSDADTALLTELISNPLHPAVNHLWLTIWDAFAIVPIALAALLLPGAKKSSPFLPPGPFIAGSAALGFFALGPLMITRKPSTSVTKEECGFITKNVFER